MGQRMVPAVASSTLSAEFEHLRKQIPHMAYPKPELPKQSLRNQILQQDDGSAALYHLLWCEL